MMEDFVHISVTASGVAVYMLLLKGEVVYVGQSRQVFERLYRHHRSMQRALRGAWIMSKEQAFIFDEVRIKVCLKSDLDREEQALIQHFRPKHNTLLNRPVNPIEAKVKDLPCIKELVRLAGEREQAKNPDIRRRLLT